MKRQEQRTEDTWNMQDLYETEELYHRDVEALEAEMENFASCRGSLGQGPGQLALVLGAYAGMNERFERIYVYAHQKYHEDTGNAVYQKLSGEAAALAARLSEATAWLEPEILALPQKKLEQYRGEEEMAGYRRFLDQVTRQREHILDGEKEALLARVSELTQAPSNIFSMFNNADIRFPDAVRENGEKVSLTQGNYISCLESTDRTLRRTAFESLYSVYGQYRNTLAAAYHANARQADFFARERRYGSALEAALDGNAIPVAVYENLVAVINRRLPLMHRYVALRKRALKLPELHMYDAYVPMVELPEKRYHFSQAKEMVKRGLKPLGEDYLALLQEGFDHRWIDVYENTGKRTGAYSWGAYGVHPYVLLNYNGTLNSVFTLAHEMGHALHSWYSDQAQPYLYAGYRIFVAEVASTCNEALLIHDLMNRTGDQEEKKYLMNYFLDQFKGTMFRQTMFAEFEMETHRRVNRGETLTAQALCDLYYELNCRYFGEEMVSDPEIAWEWARIPHFYTPFYVYQYATGFAAAVAISSRILRGEDQAVESYRQFLKGGSSMDPIDLLKLCGIDMSSPEPVEEALDVFEEYLGILEQDWSHGSGAGCK